MPELQPEPTYLLLRANAAVKPEYRMCLLGDLALGLTEGALSAHCGTYAIGLSPLFYALGTGLLLTPGTRTASLKVDVALNSWSEVYKWETHSEVLCAEACVRPTLLSVPLTSPAVTSPGAPTDPVISACALPLCPLCRLVRIPAATPSPRH